MTHANMFPLVEHALKALDARPYGDMDEFTWPIENFGWVLRLTYEVESDRDGIQDAILRRAVIDTGDAAVEIPVRSIPTNMQSFLRDEFIYQRECRENRE